MTYEEKVKLREQQDNAGKFFMQALDNAWTNAFGYKGKRPVGYRGLSKWQMISWRITEMELDKKITREQFYYLHYMYCLQREYEE